MADGPPVLLQQQQLRTHNYVHSSLEGRSPGSPLLPCNYYKSAASHVQAIFGHLALGQNEAVNPRSFWRAFRDYDGSPINVREHQDAYEFFTRLQVKTSTLIHKAAPLAGTVTCCFTS